MQRTPPVSTTQQAKRFTTYLPHSLRERIKAVARIERRTFSGQLEVIVSEWLSRRASHSSAEPSQAQPK
jgi:hypothetical protein